MKLEGRVAVVTGASSGIGKAIACSLAEEGAHVVVNDIRAEPIGGGETTTAKIAASGGASSFVTADVSRWDEVDRLISDTVKRLGRLDIIVNNAALFNATNILETTEEEWDRLMNVNLRGVFLCCKRAIMQMLDQSLRGEARGRIINISSQHGLLGAPGFCAYAVSKGGVANLTRQLAVDYGSKGILVNAVAPGRIITHTHAQDADEQSLAVAHARTPFNRLGRAEDVAGAALFLASDDATFISGVNLLVDGGWTAY
jgi:NAD(P)-dependent dehydrogenase (short-subunit alcohol dehydrogenase family)